MSNPEKIPAEVDPIPAIDYPHPRTADIDFLQPAEMASLLPEIHREIFDGSPTGEPGLSDAAFAEATEALGRLMAEVWSAETYQHILLAGGEMTGRLAAYLALRFNAALKARKMRPCFLAEIAGGASAFFNPAESAELDFETGAERWYDLREQHTVGLTIGLTSDLSTPYVCSLLDSALGEAKGHAVLVGFVAPEEARKGTALSDGRSARDLIRALCKMPQGRVLCVPVGPEPIMGSTRSKCGAAALATMIAAFLHGLEQRPAREVWDALRKAVDVVGSNQENLADLIEIGGQVLRKVGRLYHVGQGGGGIMAVIDAAECVSTFNQNPKRMKGFCLDSVAAGLESLPVHGGAELKRGKTRSQVSEEALRQELAETHASPSLLVAAEVDQTRNLAINEFSRLAVHAGGFARRLSIPAMPETLGDLLAEWTWDFAVRTALDCYSTGAHVLAGKTYGNQVIDIRMNSLGLFHEAINLVCDLGDVQPKIARQALITAIYRGDPDPRAAGDIVGHLAAAAGRSGLVARALLLVAGANLQDALTLQSREPILRKALQLLAETRDSSGHE